MMKMSFTPDFSLGPRSLPLQWGWKHTACVFLISDDWTQLNASLLKSHKRDFLGHPVIRTQYFQCCGLKFNPGQGPKVPQVVWQGKKRVKRCIWRMWRRPVTGTLEVSLSQSA